MRCKTKKNQNFESVEQAKCLTGWLRVSRVLLCLLAVMLLLTGGALLHVLHIKSQALASPDHKIRVYIDQGHNPAPYHNTGAEGNGLYEQDLTYEIGCGLAQLLREDGRFEVCLSRPDESTVLGTDSESSLQARVDGAAAFEADYFISLHINSYTEDSVSGIEVHTAIDMYEAYAFGKRLLSGMVDATGLENRGMKASADLYVLKHATMPAVLLEMGFISNPEDAALLAEHPELFAKGIYEGIVDHTESAYNGICYILLAVIGVMAVVTIALVCTNIALRKGISRRSAAAEVK